MSNFVSRVRGGIYGLLIGDALGVPYEFHSPSALPAREKIEFVPPDGFDRSHRNVPPGTWSDDGAQALCLLASLLYRHELDPDDFARRMVNWLDNGYMAIDYQVFDVGITTQRALTRVRSGMTGSNAGLCAETDNGNGSLMRVLPLAVWHQGSDAELIELARLQSRVTHGHLRSQLCCAIYSLWARNILNSEANAWEKAVNAIREHLLPDDAIAEELNIHICPDVQATGSGSGYVVDCLHSARMLCEQQDCYEDVVKHAVSLGKDTDTTACVAGGIAGLMWGEEGIPDRWKEKLRGRDIVEPLLAQLVERLVPDKTQETTG